MSVPSNQSLESQHNTGSVDRQNSLGMSVSKSFEDDEDDFNESSLIHTRIPGKKVKVTQINYISRNQLHLTAISASWVKRQNIAGLCQQTFQFSW